MSACPSLSVSPSTHPLSVPSSPLIPPVSPPVSPRECLELVRRHRRLPAAPGDTEFWSQLFAEFAMSTCRPPRTASPPLASSLSALSLAATPPLTASSPSLTASSPSLTASSPSLSPSTTSTSLSSPSPVSRRHGDDDDDDILFLVTSSRVGAEAEEEEESSGKPRLQIFRRDSHRVPAVGDAGINWEQSLLLHLILHQFEYTVTCATCRRPERGGVRVRQRASQVVYASPSRVRMDSKGLESELSFPDIFFMIHDFDEVFGDVCLRSGDMLCVELCARDLSGSKVGVIFQGSMRHEVLKRAHDKKVWGGAWLRRSPVSTFVRMRGPRGKGHAEMAVSSIGTESQGETRGETRGSLIPSWMKLTTSSTSSTSSTSTTSSSPVSSRLTYISLPYSVIINDVLELQQTPVLLM